MADSESDEYQSAEEEISETQDILQDVNTAIEQRKQSSHPDGCEQQSNLSETLENIKLSEPSSNHSSSLPTNIDNRETELTEEVVNESETTEYVSNLDNKYISESTDDIKDEKVELTEEQIKVYYYIITECL